MHAKIYREMSKTSFNVSIDFIPIYFYVFVVFGCTTSDT